MSQEVETDDENGFNNEEKRMLFLLGFDDGDLELLSDHYDFGFGQIKEEYMRILRLPREQGGFGINDVTYENIISVDNYLIPNHPDLRLRRHVVAKRTINNLSTGGKRRSNKRRSNKRRSNKRRSNKRRSNKRRTNKRRMSRRMKKGGKTFDEMQK